jgi:hypothetical protein
MSIERGEGGFHGRQEGNEDDVHENGLRGYYTLRSPDNPLSTHVDRSLALSKSVTVGRCLGACFW